MKQRFLIFLIFILLLVTLAGLNAASYVQKQKTPDNEMTPNRSTYNNGATGTQAFYTLLSETGRKVIRWQEPPDALLTSRTKPSTFVMIGAVRREITETEETSLLRWVSQGGTLIIIDREPPKELLTSTSSWKIWFSGDPTIELFSVDPTDQRQMTSNADAAKPSQPTFYNKGVNAVQPSRFSSWIAFERYEEAPQAFTGSAQAPPPPARRRLAGEANTKYQKTTSSDQVFTIRTPQPTKVDELANDEVYTFDAPVVHLTSGEKNLLVDVPFGSGTIAYLADPYIVTNGGINLVDNAQLAVNLVTAGGGLIAFDEYHQGYGSNNNRFFEYFEGTPVVAIFLQCALLAGAVFLSQSRRFARAVPEREPDRLSKLEYVSAMAELQQRTRAFDLAVENIYTDFRRRAARTVGADNMMSTRGEIARLIAERTGRDADDVDALMFKCEEIVHGEPTNKNEVVQLTDSLRELEDEMGMKRTPKRKI
jgi:hypothetical protein